MSKIESKIVKVEYKGKVYSYKKEEPEIFDNNIIDFDEWTSKTKSYKISKREELKYANACV